MPDDLLNKSPIHLLHRAGQYATDLFAKKMNGDSLTPRQFAVLSAVKASEGANQTYLVNKTGIDRSTLADIVQRMLKKGLLKRQRTEHDARAYAVYLSEEGERALNNAKPVVNEVEHKILNVLPEEKRIEFIKSLNLIVKAAES